jgi:hypothetical protein
LPGLGGCDQGGAHWIVVDTIRDLFDNHYATVCDPDANDMQNSTGSRSTSLVRRFMMNIRQRQGKQ